MSDKGPKNCMHREEQFPGQFSVQTCSPVSREPILLRGYQVYSSAQMRIFVKERGHGSSEFRCIRDVLWPATDD
ncbi:hypothetical protein ACLKMY_16900, partial [Paraburkholderia mimosarum]|uniref:hypothetical protein n=1 Tax=Paraburkholderia mimosarum TaxID=312026 RepID=UPI0039C3AAB9